MPTQPQEDNMNDAIKKLNKAYELIRLGMEDDDMLLVEEGFGYLAEAKSILEGEWKQEQEQ